LAKPLCKSSSFWLHHKLTKTTYLPTTYVPTTQFWCEFVLQFLGLDKIYPLSSNPALLFCTSQHSLESRGTYARGSSHAESSGTSLVRWEIRAWKKTGIKYTLEICDCVRAAIHHRRSHAHTQTLHKFLPHREFFFYQRAMALLQPVPRTKLGSQGLEVSSLGLGCMGMSAFYGAARPEDEMVELIRYAVEKLGVTFLDTSDAYGPFTNEVLVGKVNNTFKPAALQTIIVLRVSPAVLNTWPCKNISHIQV